jgi:hypothetical protein
MKAKSCYYPLVLSTLTFLSSVAAFAQGNKHSVDITDAVQIGDIRLAPGTYKLEWEGTGPAIQVSFERRGKTVATVPATLKTNDHQVTQDAIQTRAGQADPNTRMLEEIDFGRQKEAVVFDEHPGGM